MPHCSQLRGKFRKPSETLGVVYDENHLLVEWFDNGRVVFSFARQGDAISAHFAADKKGLRHVKQAINDFCAWVRENAPWCRMVLAAAKKPSVKRICEKCGFEYAFNAKGHDIYARKIWAE